MRRASNIGNKIEDKISISLENWKMEYVCTVNGESEKYFRAHTQSHIK